MGRWRHRHRDQGQSRNQHTGASAQRRLPVFSDALCVYVPWGVLRKPVASVAGAALPSCCVCWWAVSLLWRVAQAKTAEWPRASTASRRWHWRSGDRPRYLSGPRRTEPRSAAERLLALETKFLLFWAGQEQDSVLSRSPAPRFDGSSGLHERNLPVATLWPSPTSGTLGGRRFQAEKGGGDPRLAQGWSVGIEGTSNQAGTGMVRWTDGKVVRPAPLALAGSWASDPLRVPRIQGTVSGQQDDRFCPSLNLPIPRSIDKVPTGACGAHQATAPSTQLVGCDGDWPACRA